MNPALIFPSDHVSCNTGPMQFYFRQTCIFVSMLDQCQHTFHACRFAVMFSEGNPHVVLINVSDVLCPNACFLPVAAPPLKIFKWPCFYPNITQVRSDTRPSPAFLYRKQQKAGWGLGTRPHSSSSHVEPRSHLLQCFEVLYHSWISQCSYSLIPNASPPVFIPIKANIVKN